MKRKRKKQMSEVPTPPISPDIAKGNVENQVTLEISRPPDGQTLKIFIKAPLVAKVVRNMTAGNYEKAKYAPIYAPILKEIEGNKAIVVTRPAIARTTTNIQGGTDFSFNEVPRSILLANPEALEAGYELIYKVDQPIAYDVLKRWGKQFMEGCNELIVNAKPFRMSWVMNKMEG
jgi:hypothetical protein